MPNQRGRSGAWTSQAHLPSMLVIWFLIGNIFNLVLDRFGFGQFHSSHIADAAVLCASIYAVAVAKRVPKSHIVLGHPTHWLFAANTVNRYCLQAMAVAVAMAPVLNWYHVGPEVSVGLFAFSLIVITFSTYYAVRFGSSVTGTGGPVWRSRGIAYLAGILGLCFVGLAVILFRLETFSLGIIIPVWIIVGYFMRNRTMAAPD